MKATTCSIHGFVIGGYHASDLCGSCRSMQVVEVKLHNNDESAVKAVNETLKQLPMGGGELYRYGGAYYVQDGFVAYACERQGYVEEVYR